VRRQGRRQLFVAVDPINRNLRVNKLFVVIKK